MEISALPSATMRLLLVKKPREWLPTTETAYSPQQGKVKLYMFSDVTIL